MKTKIVKIIKTKKTLSLQELEKEVLLDFEKTLQQMIADGRILVDADWGLSLPIRKK